jgi:hypothetical protein
MIVCSGPGKNCSKFSYAGSKREAVIQEDADVAELATAFVAAVHGGYLLAQTSHDVTPMAWAIDVAIAQLQLLPRE